MNERGVPGIEDKSSAVYRNDGILGVIAGAGVLWLAGHIAWEGKWPVFMPVQLDLLELQLKVFGEPAATYIAAALIGVVGAYFVFLGVRAIVKGT